MMVQLYFGDNCYEYPNSWYELSTEQYLKLIPLINDYLGGNLSMCKMRIEWFKKIAGIDQIQVSAKHWEKFCDNLLTASRQFNFFYTLDYADKLDHLSSTTRKMLKRTPADEYTSIDGEMRYAQKLEYSYKLDAVWAKNLIPEISLPNRVLKGWTADIQSGILSTSLSALQFTQGYDLLGNISEGNPTHTLAVLTALLYGVDTSDIDSIEGLEKLPDTILQGVALNFQALTSFIFKSVHYSILWNGGQGESSTKEHLNMAFSDSLYGLCKTGYGNYEQIEKMPLLTYLNILRTDLINGVKTLAASGQSVTDIAGQMNLPIDLIEKML